MLQSVSVSFSHSIRAWMDGGCLICESAAKSNIVNIGTVIDLMPSLLVHHSTLEGSICQSLSVSLQHPSEQLFSEHSLAFNRIEMQLVEFANGIAAVRCHSSSDRNYGSFPLFSTPAMDDIMCFVRFHVLSTLQGKQCRSVRCSDEECCQTSQKTPGFIQGCSKRWAQVV